jgi:phage gp16-like protein
MPTHQQPANQRRQQLIRLIHVGKRDLHLDDETYRAMLRNSSDSKHDSSSKLTLPQLERVLDAMKTRGFKIKIQGKPAAQVMPAQDPQSQKIRALWLELHKFGYVLNPSESALAAYIKRITGIESLAWLDMPQASQIIETLKDWLNRDYNKIEILLLKLERAGKLPFQTVGQICLQVTGSDELNSKHAQMVIFHLKGL